ncbi:MAG TPA: ABC transporter permease, partial [Bacteroidota bacterium]
MRRTLEGYLFVSPWLAGFILLTAGPMIASLYISGTSWTMLSPPVWVGAQSYARLLGDDHRFGISLLNTLYYVALAV